MAILDKLLKKRTQRVLLLKNDFVCTMINPATEDKQDVIISAVEAYASDYFLEIAAGERVLLNRISHVNKFGHAPNGAQGVDTDVWDRADSTPTQSIWVAPTQARAHTIASTDEGDTGGGAGARTIRIYGLTGWDSVETSEDIIMNTGSPPVTDKAYVIIHRMKVLTKGPTKANIGTITATAAIDGTITAVILPGQGQTQMAVYGIPSTQIAYMTSYYASIPISETAGDGIKIILRVNPEPHAELLNFLVKHTKGLINTGTSDLIHYFKPYFKISGPAIIKIQAIAESVDTDISAGFDLILVNNA